MARVRNVTRGRVLAEQVEVAASFGRRLLGLMGRRTWGTCDGLWIEPCTGVHTLGMRFPIDVVLLDEVATVLWRDTVSPWRLGKVHLAARSALELPAGTLARGDVRAGDRLVLEDGR